MQCSDKSVPFIVDSIVVLKMSVFCKSKLVLMSRIEESSVKRLFRVDVPSVMEQPLLKFTVLGLDLWH